jgi:hypothetical protein
MTPEIQDSLNCLQVLLTKTCDLWFLKLFIIYEMFCEYVITGVAIYLLSENSLTFALQFEKNHNVHQILEIDGCNVL